MPIRSAVSWACFGMVRWLIAVISGMSLPHASHRSSNPMT
jgi:hypothetical protein